MTGGPGPDRLLRIVCATLVLVLAEASALVAAPQFPPLTGRVVDGANLLSAEDEAALTIDLEALEKKSTDQLVVVTLPSLQGYDIADFGYQLGRHWGIGQKGKDNGVLLIVAPTERKVRIEVGRGLEPILTDALSRLIIDNAILPKFKAGDFPGGIKIGVRDIVETLTGDPEEVRRRNKRRADDDADWVVIFFFIVWLVIVLIIMHAVITSAKEGKSGKSGWITGPSPGSSGGWRGGGFGGGGGFSGGGGGFGGGGSSGSW